MTRHAPQAIGGIALAVVLLGGCAAPIAGLITVGQLSTVISLGLTATTGKGLTEHAMDAATGKDCNVLGSILDKDRALCEVRGSEATRHDFKGIFGGEDEGAVTQKALVRAPATTPGPGLVRINGKLVYAMAPVVRPGDIANAETVRALPPTRQAAHTVRHPQPVLLRVNGKLIYTMAPVARAGDIRGTSQPPASPVPVTPAQSR